MRSNDIIIGFDPGIAITGYGVIQGDRLLEYGVLRTPAHTLMTERLLQLHTQLEELMARYPKIKYAGCEKLYFAKNVTTAFDVGQARGVIMLTLGKHHIPVTELTPLQVKQCLTGYGLAKKQQVQYMVKSIYKLAKVPQPDDAADAIAIALTTQGLT